MIATRLTAIPTNIITGFLGAGKTTTILHLLKNKPANERWAVLVNEFGEVGIDGKLLTVGTNDIFVREVPGGCMCCANGLPVQIALNRLLSAAKPHRLLIEPTGLGHPAEIITLLRSSLYQEVLDLRTTLVLVDARHLTDERYLRNTTFLQQLQVADIVIGNKKDLYSDEDMERFSTYVQTELPGKPLYFASRGELDLTLLNGVGGFGGHSKIYEATSPLFVELPERIPPCGYLRRTRQADGYFSCGWIFSDLWTFSYERLFGVLSGAAQERLKGVFITDHGIFAFNKAGDVLNEAELEDTLDSRFEIIDRAEIRRDEWQSMLMSATIPPRVDEV